MKIKTVDDMSEAKEVFCCVCSALIGYVEDCKAVPEITCVTCIG